MAARETVQRRIVVVAGLLAALAAAKLGYDAGVRIASPWLGAVMALNLAVLVGIFASLLCERFLTWLRRAPRGEP